MIRIIDLKDISLSPVEKKRMYDLMIHAYAETEADIWGANYKRLEQDEFYDLLITGQFFVAFKNDKLVGSIHVYQKRDDIYGFGLLNVDFNETGHQIGHKLIKAAENFALKQKGQAMQLEILRCPEHSEFKNWLQKWYKDQGYEFVSTVSFEDIEPNRPEKRKVMICDAVFDILKKKL